MNRRYLLCLGALAIAACTPLPSPQWSMQRVNQEFDGRDVGLFFASYGSAAGRYPLEGGDVTYRWISLEPQGGGGGGYINYPSGNYATFPADTNGDMMSGYCEVRIRTNADRLIQSITLVSDSIGKYSGSRCTEIFSQSAK